jgi:hypothetical protein
LLCFFFWRCVGYLLLWYRYHAPYCKPKGGRPALRKAVQRSALLRCYSAAQKQHKYQHQFLHL